MEVPCCGGLEMAAKKALQSSGKFLPWQVITISIYGNIIDIDNYGLGIIPEYCCPAPYQAELQEWLRNEHGVSVLVYLDETLSYIWTITCLYPRASIMEYHRSNEVWCGHYEDCLEAGLQAALRLM